MQRLLTLFVFLLCAVIGFAQPGSLDLTFDPGTGADGEIRALAIQPDGKIIIAGRFITFNGTGRNYIARVNPDGSLDTGFDPGTGADNFINACVLQPDGKIIIVGDFVNYNGTGRNHIARLNTDGSLATGFEQGPNFGVKTCALQPDGKLVIGGGTAANISRVNEDGSPDTGFDPGTGADGAVLTCILQPDGKIIIVGGFNNLNGIARNFIARLNADGSIDTGFDPGTGANGAVNTCALQPDGKIIIGGFFGSYDGTTRGSIARVNADGSLDTGFDPGTGLFNAHIYTIAMQSDGKIIIGGSFTTYNSINRNYIARVNIDGSLDTGFDPGTGGSGFYVMASAMQTDGKVMIGGGFTTYNGTPINRIARLSAEEGTCLAEFSGIITAQFSGIVTVGTVYLIQTDTPDNLWDTISTAAIQLDGSYELNSIPANHEYILLGSPDNSAFPNAIPTYHGDTIYWEFAAHITPLCADSLVRDITVKETIPGTGVCDFTGTVFLVTSGKTLTTDPIPLIDVVVKKTPPGNAIAYTTTNGSGQFTFNNMPVSDSTYSFYVNVPGMIMWQNYTITVTVPDVLYPNLNFYIDTAQGPGAGIYTTDPLPTSIKKKFEELFVYPNPTSNHCEFNFPNESNVAFTFALYDLAGKLIRKESNLQGSSFLLKTSELENGVYIAEIITDAEIFRSRIIIRE